IAILVSLAGNQNLSEILPTLSLFTVTGARILPALQETFASVMSMRFNWPALQSVRDSLTETEWNGTAEVWGDLSAGDDSARLPFNDTVRFDRVSFSYLPGSDPVLRDITLEIRRNETIGIVGPTGSGKTTLADVFLGVLEPSEGALRVDGVAIEQSNVRAWRRHVGYVPQTIFLADASIASNIAYG